MNQRELPDLESQLEQSRLEILALAERVKRLIAKRSDHEALVQHFKRATVSGSRNPSPHLARDGHQFCNLCALSHTTEGLDRVRRAEPNARCEECGEPAILFIEFKNELHN